MVRTLLTLLVLLTGCEPDPGPARPPLRDAGTPDAAGPCAELAPLYSLLRPCAECHGENGSPNLLPSALGELAGRESRYRPGHTLVVPGSPETSELYLRLAGPMPAGYARPWWMPAGHDGPSPADVLADWIRGGAEVCEESPPDPEVTDPNRYDQDALFTCSTPAEPRSSPARYRRINDLELSFASGNPVEGSRSNPVVAANPLSVLSRYSTYSEDHTVDGTTLDLLLVTLPEASRPWETRGQGPGVGGRWWTVFSGTTNPIYLDADPSDADRDAWVDVILRQATLFRSPTPEERDALRAMLDEEIALEASAADRRTTLRTVVSAAHLMVGALFRSEVGAGTADGARRHLSDEELGLALGRVLGAMPVSSTLYGDPPPAETLHPDWIRPATAGTASIDGHYAEIRDAVEDGTIAQPATLARLLSRYEGGLDPTRVDVSTELHTGPHDLIRRERGEYWLAEGITRFFREWLEVEDAEAVFKDTPNATSRWVTARSNVEATGYGHITSPYRRETLLPLLDDTIARAVVETERAGGDVFEALLTTRTFRVSANLTGVDYARPCTTEADCGESRVGACYTAIGFCAEFGTSEVNRVFGLSTDVADTHEARWVTLPATERAGVLTHPAWLTAHGGNFEDDASLVHRGRWIRENLLCDDVGGLELVTADARLAPTAPGVTARERVTAATEDGSPACILCHERMNPLGAAFEMFNPAGFLRDGAYFSLDALGARTTIVMGMDDPDFGIAGDYENAIELMTAMADSPHARRCFIRNVFRYFTGRDETPADACTLAEMELAFAGGSFFALLEALVTSDTFLYRHDGGAL